MRTYGTNKIWPVYGNYKPVERRRNNAKIAGWVPSTKQGESVSFDNTYDDKAEVVIEGNTVQLQSVWGTNLVVNGDFSKANTTWEAPYGTVSLSNETATYTVVTPHASARLEYNQKISNFTSGHKYYAAFWAYAPAAISANIYLGDAFVGGIPLEADTWTMLSASKTVTTNTELGFYISTHLLSVGSQTKYRHAFTLDLTAIFGAGNEPTAAQMDAMLAQYSNSWFDGKGQLTTDIATYTANSPSPEYPAEVKSAVGNLIVNGNVVAPIPELLNIGGVADTYNPVTGEHVPNIGKYMMTGDETLFAFSNPPFEGNNVLKFYFTLPNLKNDTIGSSNSFEYIRSIWNYDVSGFSSNLGLSRISINIPKSIVGYTDGEGVTIGLNKIKSYLAARFAANDPVDIYFQKILAVPVQETPVVIPTYPRTTVIEQDCEVKGNIIATVKIVDDMEV